MASLPISNPNIAIHLADRALTPLISSSSAKSSSPSQSQALSTMTNAAITAYDTASRLQLGLPQRIMISTSSNGPLILHSFLNPTTTRSPNNSKGIIESARDELRPLTATTIGSGGGGANGGNGLFINGMQEDGKEGEYEEDGGANAAPLLVATVVAPRAEDALDARRTAARLEKIGVEFQRAWVREQEDDGEFGLGEDG